MSVACTTYCIDANVKAPEIGDQGFIGYPSVNIEKKHNEEWGVTSYSFGWVYDGLKTIGLVPYYVEAFKQFLETYHGKTIVTVTDHDDELPNFDFDNLTQFELDDEGFIDGIYTLTCEETGETWACQYAELLKPIEKSTLSHDDVANFLEKIVDFPEFFDSFHNVTPCIDPYEDLPKIIAFIKKHQGKIIHASIAEEKV